MFGGNYVGRNFSTSDIILWPKTLSESEMIAQIGAATIFSTEYNFSSGYQSANGGNIIGNGTFGILYDSYVNKNVLLSNSVRLRDVSG